MSGKGGDLGRRAAVGPVPVAWVTGDSSFVRSITLIDGAPLVSVIVLELAVDTKLVGESDDLTGLLKSMPSPRHRVGLCNGGNVMVFSRWVEEPSCEEFVFMKSKGEDNERLRSRGCASSSTYVL